MFIFKEGSALDTRKQVKAHSKRHVAPTNLFIDAMDEHLNAPERIVKVINDVENINEGTVWDGNLYTVARGHGEYARTIVTSSVSVYQALLPF